MLAVLQKVLVDCCVADDPVAALAAARKDHPEMEAWLGHIDPEGLQLTSLLVKKLRFERILAGDPGLRDKFREDPQTFTIRFREYLLAVPPTAVFPQEEAASFKEFLAQRG